MARNTASGTPPRYGTRSDSVALRLAVTWGCAARRARERADRVFHDAADVVVAFMAAGQHDQLAAKMTPMEAALNAWKCAPALPVATLASAKADAHEDTAEAAYHVNPCRETARALVRASAAERLHAEQREAALLAQWER